MRYEDMALLVIAGGESRRMGKDKRWIVWQGLTFIERLLEKAARQNFQEIVLSVEKPSARWTLLAEKYGAVLAADTRIGYGPLEGLRSALAVSNSAYVLAVSCDMPFFDFDVLLPAVLAAENHIAVLPVTNGKKQMLAAVYSRRILPLLEKSMALGRHSLGCITEYPAVKLMDMTGDTVCFFNVNTPETLRLAEGRMRNMARRVPVVCISAAHANAGKTTLIERLLPIFGAWGLRVGVVKSDSHGLRLDYEGTDSWRFMRGGASSVAVVSPEQCMILRKTECKLELFSVAQKMEDADFVLIETRAHGVPPILEIVGENEQLFAASEKIAFLVSEGSQKAEGLLQIAPDNLELAASLLCFLTGFRDEAGCLLELGL